MAGSYTRRRATLASVLGGFNLGPFGVPLMAIGLAWIVLALLILTLPEPFHSADKVVGGAAVLAVLWHLLVLRRRIHNGVAGVPAFERTAPQLEADTAS